MNGYDKADGDELIRSVIGICEQAAKIIMAVYARPFKVRHKDDQSPVTDADIASDALINEALNAITPDYPVLSEESECPSFELRSGWKRYWLVDPLDGTQGFVSRRGDFTINVALVDGHRPVLGVIYVPESGVCYHAREGEGAFRIDRGQRPRRLATTAKAESPLRVVTGHSRRNPLTGAFIESLGKVRVEHFGSALKSCRVAEGSADVYPGFSRTSEWDTAAAQCIVEEAGGRITDLHGRPLRYNTHAGLRNSKFVVVGDTRRDWVSALTGARGGDR